MDHVTGQPLQAARVGRQKKTVLATQRFITVQAVTTTMAVLVSHTTMQVKRLRQQRAKNTRDRLVHQATVTIHRQVCAKSTQDRPAINPHTTGVMIHQVASVFTRLSHNAHREKKGKLLQGTNGAHVMCLIQATELHLGTYIAETT